MELRHLRYFEALAECLNFTRAAERVHVTQSTLSHQIRQLEEELGFPLFERVGRKVVITEHGEAFLSFASRALREVDRGIAVLREDASQITGEVRIGAAHTFNIALIPASVAEFLTRYSTVKVIVDELPADDIACKILTGELDLGVAYAPANLADVWFEPLYDDEMVLAVASAHPLAVRKKIRMVELHREPLALLPATFATRRLLDNYFRICGAEPAIVVEMNTIAPILHLVARGSVATIVSRNAVPQESGLTLVALESPTPIRAPGILWNKSEERSAPVRSLAAIIRRIARQRKPSPAGDPAET